MHLEFLAVVAIVTLLYGLVSGRAEKTPFTPPMAFVLAGLLISPAGLGLMHMELEGELFTLLAELTLALLLFSDAARMDLDQLRRHHRLPIRMLAGGMPLTLLLGAALAVWILDAFSFWQAVVAAAVLTPTDAALGQAVVSNGKVPARMRQAVNVESGLNDGIALPAVVIVVSCLSASGHAQSAGYWAVFTAKQVILGPLAGIAAGYLGGKLVARGERSGWMNRSFQDLSAIALPLACYSLAEMAGGNGFIAAFAGGLAFAAANRAACECIHEFAEAEGQLLTLLIFLAFGAFMVPPSFPHWDWTMLIYALLSLTVIRMAPVALSLLGTGLRWESVLFLSWFGPRGVASILFGLLVVSRAGELGGPINEVVALTVLLSVFAHGLTAQPASEWYARRLEKKEQAPEHVPVPHMPLRYR